MRKHGRRAAQRRLLVAQTLAQVKWNWNYLKPKTRLVYWSKLASMSWGL